MRKKLLKSVAFQDEIARFNTKTRHFQHKGQSLTWNDDLLAETEYKSLPSISRWHSLIFPVLAIIFFAAILLRLTHLQISEGERFRALSDTNRIIVKKIHAPRGVVYDRNGKILAQNEPGFRLVDESGKSRFISRDQSLQMEVDRDPRLKNLEIDNFRSYPNSYISAHLIGYVSEITERELKDPKYAGYFAGDKIGRGGIEHTYEKILRGQDGGEIIEIDAEGNPIRVLGQTPPIPGQNLKTTIDLDLQNVAYNSLNDALIKSESCCGAAIVTDPKTGHVLSLVSIPSFDPANITQSFADPNSPILNRAISGTYPPGSTFKIATSLAGLMSGKITKDTIVEDTGVYYLGPYRFANWYFSQYGLKESGGVDVKTALKRSNDIFFYHLGELTGEVEMASMAKKLGFNKLTGIDLPSEEVGLIPDDNWKRQNYNEGWYPGDSLNMSIGQGFVLTTPAQINQLTSVVASNNNLYPPHIGWQILSADNKVLKEYSYSPLKYDVKDEYLSLVRSGLELVTQPGGTAWPFFTFPIPTAGKTGTSEFGHPENKTHAWYSAYAPSNDPQIVATVLLEAGGEGSTNASPVVKEIFRQFLSPDKANLIKDTNAAATTSATLRE